MRINEVSLLCAACQDVSMRLCKFKANRASPSSTTRDVYAACKSQSRHRIARIVDAKSRRLSRREASKENETELRLMSQEQAKANAKFNGFFAPLASTVLAALFAYFVKLVWPAGYILSLFVCFFGMIIVPASCATLALLAIFGGAEPADKSIAKYGLAGSVVALLWTVALLIIVSSRLEFH